MTLSLRRRMLVVLADEGTVEHPAGKVSTVLAGMLGCTPSRAGNVLRQATRQGLVEVHRHDLLRVEPAQPPEGQMSLFGAVS